MTRNTAKLCHGIISQCIQGILGFIGGVGWGGLASSRGIFRPEGGSLVLGEQLQKQTKSEYFGFWEALRCPYKTSQL